VKEVTLKFYEPSEKMPEDIKVRDRNGNMITKVILAQNKDGIIIPACYTDQGDCKFDFKSYQNKKPFHNVVLWAEIPEEI